MRPNGTVLPSRPTLASHSDKKLPKKGRATRGRGHSQHRTPHAWSQVQVIAHAYLRRICYSGACTTRSHPHPSHPITTPPNRREISRQENSIPGRIRVMPRKLPDSLNTTMEYRFEFKFTLGNFEPETKQCQISLASTTFPNSWPTTIHNCSSQLLIYNNELGAYSPTAPESRAEMWRKDPPVLHEARASMPVQAKGRWNTHLLRIVPPATELPPG
ncbi:hypothetical protein BS47DRAFT_1349 [Hydnum rufescens UP504]|uniref:Uncharacterized protein n=1 Tax=Hydnum rufescens UP504 TaxID=1448309 RepID=A0A9P6BBD9_9AGAM|nr:hypothetical protein BS47DRAFT_1349 [Hydnum rufescens UP504]